MRPDGAPDEQPNIDPDVAARGGAGVMNARANTTNKSGAMDEGVGVSARSEEVVADEKELESDTETAAVFPAWVKHVLLVDSGEGVLCALGSDGSAENARTDGVKPECAGGNLRFRELCGDELNGLRALREFCFPVDVEKAGTEIQSDVGRASVGGQDDLFCFVLTDELRQFTYGLCRQFPGGVAHRRGILEAYRDFSKLGISEEDDGSLQQRPLVSRQAEVSPSLKPAICVVIFSEDDLRKAEDLLGTLTASFREEVAAACGQKHREDMNDNSQRETSQTLVASFMRACERADFGCDDHFQSAALLNAPAQVDVSKLLGRFGVEPFLDLVTAVLLEKRIIFTSRSLRMLEQSFRALLSAMDPLMWHGIYVPVVPRSLIDVVHAPCPYLLGLHACLISELPVEVHREAVLVDVDHGSLTVGSESEFLRMPNKLRVNFEAQLRAFESNAGPKSDAERSAELKMQLGVMFRLFTSEYLASYWPSVIDKQRQQPKQDLVSNRQSNNAGVPAAISEPPAVSVASMCTSDEQRFWEAFGETQMKQQWSLRASVQHSCVLKQSVHRARSDRQASGPPPSSVKTSFREIRAQMLKRKKADAATPGSSQSMTPSNLLRGHNDEPLSGSVLVKKGEGGAEKALVEHSELGSGATGGAEASSRSSRIRFLAQKVVGIGGTNATTR